MQVRTQACKLQPNISHSKTTTFGMKNLKLTCVYIQIFSLFITQISLHTVNLFTTMGSISLYIKYTYTTSFETLNLNSGRAFTHSFIHSTSGVGSVMVSRGTMKDSHGIYPYEPLHSSKED